MTTAARLALIPVSVTDLQGRFVYDLVHSDFTVFDNGERRPFEVDAPDDAIGPIRIVILIQTNDISNSALLKIKKAGTMMQAAVAGDQGTAAVITFADQVKVVKRFDESDADLSTIFANVVSAGTRKSRMLDAIAKALELLQVSSRKSRDVIVVIGESKDRGSDISLEKLFPAIQRSGATVYSLAYSAYLTPLTTKASDYTPPEGGRGWIVDSILETIHATKQDTCKILVDLTGGQQLTFETKAKLENDLIRLGGIIHSRYMISLAVAGDAQPGFHKIEVQVKDGSRLHVKARPGYWSIKE